MPQCLWMQAGVVEQKRCSAGFHCTDCRYDHVMKSVAAENKEIYRAGKVPPGARGKIISWKDQLRGRPFSKRPCIHHMKGRIEFRICNNGYHCGNCDFDQFFDDQYAVHTVVKPVNVKNIKGFNAPQGYYFHEGHTWVKVEKDSEVRIGIDDFALRLFGPFERIETPLLGRMVEQGRSDISGFREKKCAKFLSPVSGVVTSVNVDLRENGNSVGQSPYSNGWVMMVKPENLRNDIRKLMIRNETEIFLSSQVDLLYDKIEDIAGPLAVDGGFLGNDIFNQLPGADWEKFTGIFLRS